MLKWICCGHDIRELCERAGTSLPAKCFFCGEPRKSPGTIRYKIQDSRGEVKGTIVVPTTSSPTAHDMNLLTILKDDGFIPTKTGHSIEGQDPLLKIRDPNHRHILTLVLAGSASQ